MASWCEVGRGCDVRIALRASSRNALPPATTVWMAATICSILAIFENYPREATPLRRLIPFELVVHDRPTNGSLCDGRVEWSHPTRRKTARNQGGRSGFIVGPACHTWQSRGAADGVAMALVEGSTAMNSAAT